MTKDEELQLQKLLLKKHQENDNSKSKDPITKYVGGTMYALFTLGIGPLFDYLDDKD